MIDLAKSSRKASNIWCMRMKSSSITR